MEEKLTINEIAREMKKVSDEYAEKNKEKNKIVCKRCGSENIQVQKIATQVKKKKGLMYWSVGWIIDLMLWIFLTLPRLIIAMFKPNKTVTQTHTEAVCQNCGKSWRM